MHLFYLAEVLPLLRWFAAGFNAFAPTAAPVAIAALWQGTAVAAGLALCLRLAPRLSAAHRFTVWATGFGVLIGLQVFPLFAPFTSPAYAVHIVPTGSISRPWFELDVRWSLAIAGLWLAIAAYRAADLLLHSFRLHQLWKSAKPIDEPSSAAQAGAPGRKSVQVCTTSALDRPSVIGFFAPRILIPDWLYARLTADELEQVILHESEHLRRCDDWTNLLQKLSLVLFPLNPVLAWVEHRLCREREMACDEGVVRMTRAPRAYAACLASLAERGLEQSLARRAAAALSLGAFERRSELVHRVHGILGRKHVLGPLAARALLGVVGCGLLLGSVELARCPQMVAFVYQQPTPAPPVAGAAPAEPLQQRKPPSFQAVNVKATLPAAPRKAVVSRAASQRPDEASPADQVVAASSRNSVPAAARQELVKAEMDRNSAGAETQQWIVVTAWEQIEMPAAGAGRTADYDTSANPDARTENNPRRNAAAPITITRLIVRIYPAGSGTNAGSAKGQRFSASRNEHSHYDSGRPSALPLGNGWLVLQL